MSARRFVVILAVCIIFVSAVVVFQQFTGTPQSSSTVPVPTIVSKHAVSFGIASAEGNGPVTVDSADGSMKLIMSVVSNANGNAYTLLVSDSKGTKKPIFTQTLPQSTTLTIPDNAWSPDGSYVFIQEHNGATVTSKVLRTSGDAFTDGSQFETIEPGFTRSGLSISQVTGWASPTLLVFETKNADGSKGPLFWFDVPSKSYIELAR